MMTIPERAAQIAVQIANDDRHGYSQANRYGTLEGGDFDCSSLVIYCYHRAFMEAGIAPTPQNAGASYTGNMYRVFLECGFEDVTADIIEDVRMTLEEKLYDYLKQYIQKNIKKLKRIFMKTYDYTSICSRCLSNNKPFICFTNY